MTDSYWSVALVEQDTDLQRRVIACAAVENIPDPSHWAMTHSWDYASQPGWGAAWDSALVAGNPAPGRDPAVITDAQILSAVQAIAGQASPQ